LLHGVGGRGCWDPKVLRREAEASPLRDTGKQAHLIEVIHYSRFSNSFAEYWQIIRAIERANLSTGFD
jgi:hypothetical protein